MRWLNFPPYNKTEIRICTLNRRFPQAVGLRLVFRAVHRTAPSVRDCPGLVRFNRQKRLVSGFRRGAQRGYDWHVKITRYGLVRARRVSLVEGKLLSTRRELLSRNRRVHVFIPIGGGLRAGLGHPTLVIAAAKISIGQRSTGRVLYGWTRTALFDRFPHARSWHLTRRVGCARVGDKIPALVSSKIASHKSFHVFAHIIQAVVIEEHHRVNPAGMEE